MRMYQHLRPEGWSTLNRMLKITDGKTHGAFYASCLFLPFDRLQMAAVDVGAEKRVASDSEE